MELLGIDGILPAHKEIMFPLIAWTEGDRKPLLMKEAFESIVRMSCAGFAPLAISGIFGGQLRCPF